MQHASQALAQRCKPLAGGLASCWSCAPLVDSSRVQIRHTCPFSVARGARRMTRSCHASWRTRKGGLGPGTHFDGPPTSQCKRTTHMWSSNIFAYIRPGAAMCLVGHWRNSPVLRSWAMGGPMRAMCAKSGVGSGRRQPGQTLGSSIACETQLSFVSAQVAFIVLLGPAYPSFIGCWKWRTTCGQGPDSRGGRLSSGVLATMVAAFE